MTRTDGKATRRDELAHFYARCHRGLFWAVRRNTAETDDDLIHEACAVAWLALVRRTDATLDRRGYTWLVITATHEARHICHLAEGRARLRGEL